MTQNEVSERYHATKLPVGYVGNFWRDYHTEPATVINPVFSGTTANWRYLVRFSDGYELVTDERRN